MDDIAFPPHPKPFIRRKQEEFAKHPVMTTACDHPNSRREFHTQFIIPQTIEHHCHPLNSVFEAGSTTVLHDELVNLGGHVHGHTTHGSRSDKHFLSKNFFQKPVASDNNIFLKIKFKRTTVNKVI